jgi:hypothetical protein
MGDDLGVGEKPQPGHVVVHVVRRHDDPDLLAELLLEVAAHLVRVGAAGQGVHQENVAIANESGRQRLEEVAAEHQDVGLDRLDTHFHFLAFQVSHSPGRAISTATPRFRADSSSVASRLGSSL